MAETKLIRLCFQLILGVTEAGERNELLCILLFSRPTYAKTFSHR